MVGGMWQYTQLTVTHERTGPAMNSTSKSYGITTATDLDELQSDVEMLDDQITSYGTPNAPLFGATNPLVIPYAQALLKMTARSASGTTEFTAAPTFDEA
jgi:hypothetical protein